MDVNLKQLVQQLVKEAGPEVRFNDIQAIVAKRLGRRLVKQERLGRNIIGYCTKRYL